MLAIVAIVLAVLEGALIIKLLQHINVVYPTDEPEMWSIKIVDGPSGNSIGSTIVLLLLNSAALIFCIHAM